MPSRGEVRSKPAEAARREVLYRAMAERVLGEVRIAAGMQGGLSDIEVCRRAGYATHYFGRLRAQKGLPSLRFLADVEDALGVTFQITAVPKRAD